MRWRSRAAEAPSVPGERVLAWCEAGDGHRLAGTREALHLLPEGRRIGWEDLQAVDWDRDSGALLISEVGEWGRPRPEHRFVLDSPGRLLELVRERVTASVLLQRQATVRGRLGVRVIARRAPAGDRPVRWIYEIDEGLDPEDPTVRATLEALLARTREEAGGDLV